MASATTYFPSRVGDLWMLAGATVIDAREVASELPEKPTALSEVLQGLWTLVSGSITLRGHFHRLVDRQGQLLARLQSTNLDCWPRETCLEMANLLESLVTDEREMLEKAYTIPIAIRAVWGNSLESLKTQVVEIQSMYIHMDALSVPVLEMPGDDAMRGFISTLGESEEFDFEVDRDLRRNYNTDSPDAFRRNLLRSES